MCLSQSVCTEGWHQSGGNVRLALREVGLNKVLTEGAEPTPLEMNVLCRVIVGRTVAAVTHIYHLCALS